MEYYDIELNFSDQPVQFYDWFSDDNIERLLKILVIRVDDIKDVIDFNCNVALNDGKYVITDLINSIAIEVINSSVVYLSYLKYDDDNYICSKANKLNISDIGLIRKDKRLINNSLRSELFIKLFIKKLLESSNDDLIKYVYYDITKKINNDVEKCRSYLISDIDKNINNYYGLYEMIKNK